MSDDRNLSKLKEMYREAESVDKAVFSEQRSNILLKNGDHYKKNTQGSFDVASRSVVKKSNNGQIRLVKNHLHRICNLYSNSILENDPIPTAEAANESDFHDSKVAKMTSAVFKWVRETNNWDAKSEDFIEDFVVLTECYARVWFNYDKGPSIAVDELTGTDIKAGEFEITRIMPYDMKRDPDCMSLDDARYLIETKLMTVSALEGLAISMESPDVEKIQKQYSGVELSVFDSSVGRYKKVKGKVEVRIFYWRPSPKNPKGLFTVMTDDFIIGSQELPLGIFPIVYTGFDRLTNSPRHSGIIRVCKPYQVKYNRANSKMAEHQITLGDDRVYLHGNSKLTGGKLVHGVRQFHLTGDVPTIQSGRSGAQYLEYARDTKADMYEAANIDYAILDKAQSGDSFQMLYASIKDKKKFVKYVRKYERFVTDVYKLVSTMSKEYLTPLHIIKIAGEKEAMNIEEFKDMDDAGFEVKIGATAGDVESKFGKVLTLTQILQYVGSSLSPEQVGSIIKQLPYNDGSTVLNTLTMKTENAENLILALDRGQYVQTMKYDDHEFLVNALYSRMKQADFPLIDQQSQQLYSQKIQELEMYIAQKMQELQQAQLGAIPADGYLTTVNQSWTNPDTGKVERIKLPTGSIMWLTEQLRKQGAFAQSLGEQNPQIMADLAQLQQPQANNALLSEQQPMPQA